MSVRIYGQWVLFQYAKDIQKKTKEYQLVLFLFLPKNALYQRQNARNDTF